jgi:predicted CoA-binding protein
MTEKTPAQKLLIKEGYSVLLINPPNDYRTLLGEFSGCSLYINQGSDKPDVIVVFLENRSELEGKLPEIKPLLKPKTLLWLCYHKGTSKIKTDINRDTINAYCMTKGLQGIAMISINDDWSSLRAKISE